jgi:streptogramin lyase
MSNARILARVSLVALTAASVSILVPVAASAADVLLSGKIVSAAGEKMGGVTVSAKPIGGTIRTSVFTDEAGEYYFPPLPEGKYQVTAQAVTFGTGKNEVDLAGNKQANFTLSPIAVEDNVQQLPGGDILSSLPANSDEEARLRQIVRNNCTGCHTPSFTLQHRFDAAGWTAIMDLMKHINSGGTYQAKREVNQVVESHEKELAAYLAGARGPGKTTMKFNLQPRPSGESARVVFREYDIPVNPDSDVPPRVETNDGTDWMLGTPSVRGNMIHDAWADLDGNLVFSDFTPNHSMTIGRIDIKTGAVKALKVQGPNGLAASAHGLTRDPNGIFWFSTTPTVRPEQGNLGRLDPKTDEIQVFVPPATMPGVGGAPTLDWDGKGKIWTGANDGALRFDPQTQEFTHFKSVTQNTQNGFGRTYGVAADRDGNGWWAQMTVDIIGHGDSATGKPSENRLLPVKGELDLVTPDEQKVYANYAEPDFNTPLPWQQGPRRMGTDKNGDVLYVGDSWGGNLARIDTKTMETTYIPTPNPVGQQPYHITVDKNHDAWLNLWTTDQILRYDPASSKWTAFDLPTRGTEARYISLLERDNGTEVVVPEYRPNKIAVMTFRSQADIDALKKQAQ